MAARGLQAVKPSSGMLLPNGVKVGSNRLLLPLDFRKPLVDALEKYVQLGQSKAHLAVTGDRSDT